MPPQRRGTGRNTSGPESNNSREKRSGGADGEVFIVKRSMRWESILGSRGFSIETWVVWWCGRGSVSGFCSRGDGEGLAR